MKTVFLLLLITLSTAFPQHTRTIVRQPTFKGDVRSFSVVNTTMYVIGYNLSVNSFTAKSTNQGETWTILPSPSIAEENLEAISFPTEQTGYIGGSNGAVYKTTNGGAAWFSVRDTNVYNGGINVIFFLNKDTGFVAGSLSNSVHMMKTTNGGLTWTAVNTGATQQVYDLLFLPNGRGWATCSSGKFLYTTDMGATWTVKNMPNTTTGYHIRRVTDNVFYISGTLGTVAKSTDGGLTFATTNTGTSLTFYTHEFFDENNGWVFGTNGNAYFTTNGGTSWTQAPSFTNEVIRTSIFAFGKVFAGAYKSTIAANTGTGTTWNILTTESRDYYGINVESPASYAIAGDRGMAQTTTNGGLTWKKSAFMSGNLQYDVYKNGQNLYLCGRNGEFHRSTDGGATWNSQLFGTSTTRMYKFFFFTPQRGYMVSNESNIHYTTDGGVTWSVRSRAGTSILYDIKMLSDTVGFVCGSADGIYATTNGTTFLHGTLFTPGRQMTGIAMLSPTVGFLCGENGIVYKTTNGFQTATLLTDTVALQGRLIHDIIAFSEDNVWAVGQGGLILRLTSPAQMTVVDTAAGDLYAAAKLSSNSFLCTGASGYVYKIVDEFVPVELTAFTARRDGERITLAWTTATETNNRGFEVQISENGKEWRAGGFVQGNGNSTQPRNYSVSFSAPSGDALFARLRQIDYDGKESFSPMLDIEGAVSGFELSQNYPNPFNPATIIRYSTRAAGPVKLTVYDALGREAAVLVNETQEAGSKEARFDASLLPSGIYFYELNAEGTRLIRKMALIR